MVGAWSAFETITIPTGITTVQTSDTLAPGSTTGTASALYKEDAEQTEFTTQMQTYVTASIGSGTPRAVAEQAMRDLQKLWRRKSADGRWFTLAEPEPWTGQFGCPGDGGMRVKLARDTGVIGKTMSGTDVFAQFQGFIDYCVYFARCQGRIGKGMHRVSRGLQHGYGDNFVGGVFRGAGQAFGGSLTFVGSTLICDTDEDPVLNIAGDRDVLWEGVSFRGPYDAWLFHTNLGYPTNNPAPRPVGGSDPSYPFYDCLDPQAWIADYMRPSQDGRYNPAALVTLGAFDGAKPVALEWAANTSYTIRDCVRVNGQVYTCIEPGTSALSGKGPTSTAAAIADGHAKWRWIGAADAADVSKHVAYREPYRPAWLRNPAGSAYGNNRYGSFCTFRDCTFYGSPTLVVSKPGPDALQGDFLSFDRCNFTNFNFAISAGNHQLRTFQVQGSQFGAGNCALTNLIHGNRNGSFKACHIDDTAFGASVDIFRVNASYGEPMVFTGCYCEGQFRLGQILGGGRTNMGPLFNGCEWNLTGVHPARGRAARQLYAYPDGTPGLINEAIMSGVEIPTRFVNCKINVDSVFSAFVPGVTFVDSIVGAYDRVNRMLPPFLAAFNNATAGGLVLAGLDYRQADHRAVFGPHLLDSGAPASLQVRTEPGYKYGDRSLCIPAMVKTVRAGQGATYEELVVPHEEPFLLLKSPRNGGVKLSFSNPADPTEMKIVLNRATKAMTADLQGFGAGSVCIDGLTGTVFAVKSFDETTGTLVAIAQDNFREVGGKRSFIRPVATDDGQLAFLHARNYTPAIPLFGDFTSGDARIANVGTGAGDGSGISANVKPGDYLASPQELRAYAPAIAAVTATSDGSPGSITLDTKATRSATGVRLGFFRRPSA